MSISRVGSLLLFASFLAEDNQLRLGERLSLMLHTLSNVVHEVSLRSNGLMQI